MLAEVQAFQDVPSFDANALRLGCLDDHSGAIMSLAHASSFTMTSKADPEARHSDASQSPRSFRKIVIPCGPLSTL